MCGHVPAKCGRENSKERVGNNTMERDAACGIYWNDVNNANLCIFMIFFCHADRYFRCNACHWPDYRTPAQNHKSNDAEEVEFGHLHGVIFTLTKSDRKSTRLNSSHS